MNALIFCCEWDTKIIHTIFSYILTSLSNDMGCGKTLALWFFEVSNEIYEGVTPCYNHIARTEISVPIDRL